MSDLAEMLFIPASRLEQVHELVGTARWAELRSAYELARSWLRADGFPASIQAVLDASLQWRGAELVRGFFEHGDMLDGRRGPSRTDLMVIARTSAGLAAIAVEGKVDEPFDNQTVRQWGDNASDAKRRRLETLCRTLAVEPALVSDVRYQLVHRSAAAIREARRFGAQDALMLVHAFTIGNSRCDPGRAIECVEDYTRFAEVLGLSGCTQNTVGGPRDCGGMRLWLAWVDCAPLPPG